MNEPSLIAPREPYKGLESFKFADQSIFCERKQELRELGRAVVTRRTVLLFGESGAGKSSLVNAGLLPFAISEGLSPIRLRVGIVPGGEIIVERVQLGDDDSWGFLPCSIAGELPESASVVLSAVECERRIREVPASLPTPLLIFDQFEEFVTLADELGNAPALQKAREAQDATSKMIASLAHDPDVRVKLLIVFREEYLARFHGLFVQCSQLFEKQIRLVLPSTDSLKSIVAGPFAGDAFSLDHRFSSELVDSVVAAFSERLRHDLLNLSELQVVCLRLWRAAEPLKVLALRGVDGLIEDSLNEALVPLPRRLQDASISILTKLVTRAGTRNVVTEDDLATLIHAEENLTRHDVEAALWYLVSNTRLVRRERRRESYFYEIVSEFLVPWIVSKQRKRRSVLRIRRWRRRIVLTSVLTFTVFAAIVFSIHSDQYTKALADSIVQNAKNNEREAKSKAAKAESDLAAARKHDDDLNNTVSNLTVQLSSTQTVLANQKQQDDHDKKEAEKQISQLNNIKDGLDKEIIDLRSENSMLNTQNQRLTADYKNLKAEREQSALSNNFAAIAKATKQVDTTGNLHLLIGTDPYSRKHQNDYYSAYIDGNPLISGLTPNSNYSVQVPLGTHKLCIALFSESCEAPRAVDITIEPTTYVQAQVDTKTHGYVPCVERQRENTTMSSASCSPWPVK